ncbi:unnamed protein product [Hymenolepis diminuta]|nr:unnamed protein product [Hymenolepis diminuta]
MHNRHHFLFFNRAQSFLNTLDDFLPPIRPKIELQSAMAVRFCLNDIGFRMPDNGLPVFTTLLKVKLTCRVRIQSLEHQEAFFSRSRQVHSLEIWMTIQLKRLELKWAYIVAHNLEQLPEEDHSVVNFDHIVTSSSFIGADKDLYFVGLFAPSKFSRPLQRLRRTVNISESPMALCIFRRSDLDSLLNEAPLVVQMQNEPIKELLALNRTKLGKVVDSSRFMKINKSEEYLNSFQHCRRTKNHAAIKGIFVGEPWKPMSNGEALAILQTRERFAAMLVDSADSFSDLPRRKLTQGQEICILYLFTESSNLMVFLISKRDLFQFNTYNGKSNLTKSNLQDLLLIGGIELLFSVVLSPAFVSPFIRMEFTAFREITISDHQRLAVVDLKSCFTASFYDYPEFTSAKYLSIEKDTEIYNSEVFRWRTVKLACQLPHETGTFNTTLPARRFIAITKIQPPTSPSSSSVTSQKSVLLPIVWVLSILSVILSIFCFCLLLAYIRSKHSYLRKIISLRETTVGSNAHCHQNTFQGREMITEVVNLSQPSAVLDPDCSLSTLIPSDHQTKVTNSLDIMAVSEPRSKTRSYPVATFIPSLPMRNRQLNNDLELRTFKVTPIR